MCYRISGCPFFSHSSSLILPLLPKCACVSLQLAAGEGSQKRRAENENDSCKPLCLVTCCNGRCLVTCTSQDSLPPLPQPPYPSSNHTPTLPYPCPNPPLPLPQPCPTAAPLLPHRSPTPAPPLPHCSATPALPLPYPCPTPTPTPAAPLTLCVSSSHLLPSCLIADAQALRRSV